MQWTAMRLVVLLLLSLQSFTKGITNCGEDSRFKVTESSNGDHYELQLCTSRDNCTHMRNFVNLNDQNQVCRVCGTIPGLTDQECSKKVACKKHISSFLNDYCENTTFDQNTHSRPTQGCITPTPCTTRQQTCSNTTVVVSKVITSIIEPTQQSACTNHQLKKVNAQAQVAALGALTGLLLVVLVLVITGWVWTCWIMRKIKTQLSMKCRDCEEKRSYPNPTYGMTTENKPAVGTVTQLHSQEVGNGQMHNVINRADNQQSQVRNEIKEGGSEEEHTYHILEKSGDDDYEDPDKDLEESTAGEYETPVPLREI